MENIFKNAYFGKTYKTKDGTIVKFILKRGENDFSIYIPKCTYSIETTHRYNSKGEFYLGGGEYGHAGLDIISEWQEEINEEEVNAFAHNMATNYGYAVAGGTLERPLISEAYLNGFKTGYDYKKSKENKL